LPVQEKEKKKRGRGGDASRNGRHLIQSRKKKNGYAALRPCNVNIPKEKGIEVHPEKKGVGRNPT